VTNSDVENLISSLTEEESAFIDVFVFSNEVYDAVISQLNIDHDDFLYHDLVKGMLERRTKDFLVFAIWNNLSKKQLKHLDEFISQKSSAQVSISKDELLMEFALLYPKLMKKIYKDLSGFFQDFIDNFNRILAS